MLKFFFATSTSNFLFSNGYLITHCDNAFQYVFIKSYMHICQLELQNTDLVPSDISYHFSERYVGYSLDNADLVSFVNLIHSILSICVCGFVIYVSISV